MTTNPLIYTCSICHGVNFASRIHCQHCGTIPAKYSVISLPAAIHEDENLCSFVEVCNAPGCERQNRIRTSKTTARTVRFDYYADLTD